MNQTTNGEASKVLLTTANKITAPVISICVKWSEILYSSWKLTCQLFFPFFLVSSVLHLQTLPGHSVSQQPHWHLQHPSCHWQVPSPSCISALFAIRISVSERISGFVSPLLGCGELLFPSLPCPTSFCLRIHYGYMTSVLHCLKSTSLPSQGIWDCSSSL